MIKQPPPEVVQAIEEGTAKIFRRTEFFELDGETVWKPGGVSEPDNLERLVGDASVSIDSTRDERRNFDATFDNRDGKMSPDAHGGFWYDKIIVPYKGVYYQKITEVQTVDRTNQAPNPGGEAAGGWLPNNVQWAVTYSTVNPISGTRSVRCTKVAGGAAGRACASMYGVGGDNARRPVTAGERVTASVDVIAGQANYETYIQIAWYDSSLAHIGSITGTIPSTSTSSVVRPSVSAIAPSNAVSYYIIGTCQTKSGFGNAADNDWAAFDNCLIERGTNISDTPGAYFDGNSGSSAWTGTANASTSVHYVLTKEFSTETWEVQMGEFVPDSIDEQNFPLKVKVVGRDKTVIIQASKFAEAATFTAATNLGDFVKNIAAKAGIHKVRIPANLPKLGTDYAVERGTSRWQAIHDNVTAKSYQAYFDNEGYLVVAPMADPFLDPTEMVFKTGLDGNLSEWSKGVNSGEVYNDVIVIGERADDSEAVPFFGRATNNDPSSPTSTVNIGHRMMDPIVLSTMASNADCAALAKATLKIAGLESYTFQGKSINYPWIEAGISVWIDEPTMKVTHPRRYLLDTATVRLGPGPMEWTAKRITTIGTTIETPDPVVTPPVPEPEVPPETVPPVDTTEPPPEPPTTVGPTLEISIVSYNFGPERTGGDGAKLSSLNMLERAGADIICVQEGSDRGPAMTRFLQQNRDWTGYLGTSIWHRHVAILWRKNLGDVVRKQFYYQLEPRYLGGKGTKNPRNEPKYICGVDIVLKNGRRLQILNNHMIAGANRSRTFLGATEYARRRAAFTKQVTGMVNQIDTRQGLVFHTGDYNARSDFSLLAPLMSRVTVDNTANTSPGTRIDFVGRRAHAAISVVSQRNYNVSSDHEAPMVTYLIKGA